MGKRTFDASALAHLSVRLHPDVASYLKTLAAYYRATPSELIRNLILGGMQYACIAHYERLEAAGQPYTASTWPKWPAGYPVDPVQNPGLDMQDFAERCRQFLENI